MDQSDKQELNGEQTTGKELPGADRNRNALTRRQWFLRLGETVVLAGFSGVAGEEMMVLEAQTHAADATQALPPGLYTPSSDHMKHVLFRDEPFVNPPIGSTTEYAKPHPLPFKPAFFSAEDFSVVKQLVSLVLNAQENAAADARLDFVNSETVNEIAEWIDLVVSEAAAVREAARRLSAPHRSLAVKYYGEEAVQQIETGDAQATWREGLNWLKQQAEKFSVNGFVKLSEAQQLELLNSISKPASDGQAENAGTQLYRLLKNQTVEGYYTSKAGLKELDYKGNAFYAESPGCPNH